MHSTVHNTHWVSPSSIKSYQNYAYLTIFSIHLSFDSKNTFRSILMLAALRDQPRNSLSKVIIAIAFAGPIMRTKALKITIRSKPTKYPVRWCVGRNVETPSYNISKMHESRFFQNFECSSTIARKLQLCGYELKLMYCVTWGGTIMENSVWSCSFQP